MIPVQTTTPGMPPGGSQRTTALDSLRRGLSASHMPALDGVRAIAAYMVVVSHYGLDWVPAGLGVLAFFVLSGFLITWLLLKEDERYGAVSLRLFYARRSLRIFPAFYVYAGIVIGGLLLVHGHIVWPQAISSLFYVNNYYQALRGDPGTGLSHTWSLGVEEQFYLLWPLAFVTLSKRPRRMVRVLMAGIVCVWFYRWVLRGLGVDQGYLYEAFDTRADHLMVGCLLAVVLRHNWWTPVWRFLCSSLALPVMTLGLLVLSTVFAFHMEGYRDTAGFIIDPLLVATLLVQLIAMAESAAWGWTNWPPLRYLGRISYSVYLYQQITPRIIERALRGYPPGLLIAANVVLVTLAASASYWIIETPFLMLKDRIGRRAHG